MGAAASFAQQSSLLDSSRTCRCNSFIGLVPTFVVFGLSILGVQPIK
jgi:hypothetical protein